jgi:hypothetical protein
MPAIVFMGALIAGKATLLQRQGSRFRVQVCEEPVPLLKRVSQKVLRLAPSP